MANKKISELSSAGALTGTESVEIVQGGANVKTTTQDIADLGGGGGGGGTWGSITGTLSSQTDLQAALNEKSDAIATTVSGSTNYTLQASDLTLINAGASVIIEGDGTGTLTIPLDATVDFPDNCFIGFRGFILVAAAGGVTATPTNSTLDCDPDFLFSLEKTATNTWNVHNGSAGGGGGGGEPLTLTSASTAGGTITLDMDNLTQKMFYGSATFSSAKLIALSNTTNALVFNFFFEVTNVAGTLQVPSDWLMSTVDFDGTTWTPPSTGKYEIGGSWNGTNWYVKIAGPFI